MMSNIQISCTCKNKNIFLSPPFAYEPHPVKNNPTKYARQEEEHKHIAQSILFRSLQKIMHTTWAQSTNREMVQKIQRPNLIASGRLSDDTNGEMPIAQPKKRR